MTVPTPISEMACDLNSVPRWPKLSAHHGWKASPKPHVRCLASPLLTTVARVTGSAELRIVTGHLKYAPLFSGLRAAAGRAQLPCPLG